MVNLLATFSLLKYYPFVFAIMIGFVGLLVGSFLNVVVYRLPMMLKQTWERDALGLLGLEQPPYALFNLATPNSRCPSCGHPIRPWENIPVVSWLALRGRCAACKTKISVRYPIVEMISGILTFYTAWHFGYGIQTAFAVTMVWGCIALFLIDLDEMLLPDVIVIPGIWIGLAASYFGVFTTLSNAFIGAAAGYLVFAIPAWVYSTIRRRQGMGSGDFKLLALFGAWMGWQALPIIVLLSAVSAAIIGLVAVRVRAKPYPFGPFIIAAGLLALFYSRELYALYSAVSGVSFGAKFFE